MVDDMLARIDQAIERNIATYTGWLAKLVAVPSVAAQDFGIKPCASLVASMLNEQGYQAEVIPTEGNPVVYAEGGAGSKTLMFYNHYDVQPAEPMELWLTPPFEMTQRGDKLYGRGTADDKGHIVARLAALHAVRQVMGEVPCRVKFVVEGEEEIGSIHLPAFIDKNKEKLAADACVWESGGVDYDGTPLQYLGLRGICYVELAVRTATLDAHSGLGGSIFPNAAWRLVWALGTLKDRNEKIAIPGFYDNVQPPSDRDNELLAALPDNAANMMKTYGLKAFLQGMTGGVELRRTEVFEPTCTICGITAGYQGEGAKTVLPAEASAKLDFRLVPKQTLQEVLEKLRKHLDAQGFQDVAIIDLGGNRPARTDPDHPFIKLSNEAARQVYGRSPIVHPLIGVSGPAYPFIHVLGMPVTTCGVSYPGAQVHAPNEHIVMGHFISGIKHTAHIIAGFGKGD